jgi:hypothetical protein
VAGKNTGHPSSMKKLDRYYHQGPPAAKSRSSPESST